MSPFLPVNELLSRAGAVQQMAFVHLCLNAYKFQSGIAMMNFKVFFGF